jgi:hypothetical protein
MSFTQICCDVHYVVVLIIAFGNILGYTLGTPKSKKKQKLLEINLKIVHRNKIELALA